MTVLTNSVLEYCAHLAEIARRLWSRPLVPVTFIQAATKKQDVETSDPA
jgi:hypothetical protein